MSLRSDCRSCRLHALLQDIRARYPKLVSMEMETFHLYDMARSSKGSIVSAAAAIVVRCRGADSRTTTLHSFIHRDVLQRGF